MVLLNRSEGKVLAAVESGSPSWDWDSRREGAERREIRVWRDSLLDLVNGTRLKGNVVDVYPTILPPRPARTTELQRFWSRSITHVTHLLEDSRREASSGRNAFARICSTGGAKARRPAGPNLCRRARNSATSTCPPARTAPQIPSSPTGSIHTAGASADQFPFPRPIGPI